MKYEIIPHLERAIIIDSLAEYSSVVDLTYQQITEAVKKPIFRFRFLPINEEEVENIINFLIDKKIKDFWLIIDEISMYSNPYHTLPSIEYMVKYGRHNGINQVYIARRPQEISRLITAMADVFIIFNSTEKRDLEYLASISDILPDKVKELKRMEYIIYDVENQSYEKYQLKSFKYLPIKFTPLKKYLTIK